MALSERDVDIGYVFTEPYAHEAALARCRAVLSAEETARGQRLLFEKDRQAFFIRRAFLRTLLSSGTGVDPVAWQFALNPYGKPGIAAPKEFSALHFNLSHRQGVCICGLAWGHDLGVDVEDTRQEVDAAVEEVVFSASERAFLARQHPAQRKEAFFRLWTLKEAYIKAHGEGMSLPLTDISISFDLDPTPCLVLAGALSGDARPWNLVQFPIGAQYLGALAVSCFDCQVNVREWGDFLADECRVS
jgi:4'-phosphopantetheinyl transferase